MSIASAIPFFGEKQDVAKIIAKRIHEARMATGLVPEELGELANLENPLQVADFESGAIGAGDISVSDIMAIATQLGIKVERLMPLRRELTDEEKTEWEIYCEEAKARPVAAADGCVSFTRENKLELFIRIRALQEIFGRAPAPRGSRVTPETATRR